MSVRFDENDRRCPRCGSVLVSDGKKLWCANVTHWRSCGYGGAEPVTIESFDAAGILPGQHQGEER